MARKANNSDQALIELFLDMLAAERGGAQEHARRLCSRPRGFLGAPRRRRALDRGRLDRRPARLSRSCSPSAALPRRRWRGGSPRSASSIASSTRREGAPTIRPPSSKGRSRGRSLPKVLSIADVDRLLRRRAPPWREAAEPPERLRAARLTCLIEVLYATGLRVSELVALPASAAERNARMLVVRGKGDKERLVPLNDAAKTAMRDYLALAGRGRQRREREAQIEMAVSVLRRERPPHAPAFRPRAQGARRRRRPARRRR